MHRQSSAGTDALALGVKSRLSNEEMETLRAKLAQAVAYDHVPCDAKRAERLVKAQHAAKPMTKLYHRVDESNAHSSRSFRPGGKKTLASIQYEAAFTKPASDALRVLPPATKGISAAAKTRLQDEYVTNPRRVSSIPLNLQSRVNDDESDDPSKLATKSGGGKRAAPAQIPQVFI